MVILDRCSAPAVIIARLRAAGRRLLHLVQEPHAELTVSLVDDFEIQRLNQQHRGIDRPTDVLAFAMREGPRAPGDESLLGDVVISVPTATRQAQRRRVEVGDELQALLTHGVLHLLGYDHERSAGEAQRMRRLERQLRRQLAEAPGRR